MCTAASFKKFLEVNRNDLAYASCSCVWNWMEKFAVINTGLHAYGHCSFAIKPRFHWAH